MVDLVLDGSSKDAEDDALLAAYAAGDSTSARLLLDRLAPTVMGHAMRVLQDRAEAEDVVQEAMVRLWKQAPEWRYGEAKVSTWLYRVTANLCTDRLRKRRGGSVDIDAIAEPMDPTPGVDATMQDLSRAKALRSALADLPERQAMAVSLRHLEGLSNPEIANVMEIGVEAVESLIARGKRSLRAALLGQKEALGYDDA
ncbi:MAG: RNA polymerase sigma factor [Pseudomonadota bacterium]